MKSYTHFCGHLELNPSNSLILSVSRMFQRNFADNETQISCSISLSVFEVIKRAKIVIHGFHFETSYLYNGRVNI
jgi:hypothetical protein